MKRETKTVHWGDRRKAGDFTPVTTPIYTAASYAYESMDQLDRIFAMEESGPSYARYDNPTRSALEEVCRELESGAGAIACASGMIAIQTAITACLLDRPKRALAANMMYGATTAMLMNIFEPLGVEVSHVNPCDVDAFKAELEESKPGFVILESISNPLLRVPPLDQLCKICKEAGVPVIVDNTFATPMLLRPLELGATIVCHSATKYLSGHGDVLGGMIVADPEYYPILRGLCRTSGPVMGPFESYLTMRGIKTLGLRLERQCANAAVTAQTLERHPRIAKVYYPGLPDHPDAETIARLLPEKQYGGLVSFEIQDKEGTAAGRPEIFRFMEKLQMIVRATSLGDVHSIMLYPAMSSHRDLSPKHRERLGIHDNLVRLSAGIEAIEDILADLNQALEA